MSIPDAPNSCELTPRRRQVPAVTRAVQILRQLGKADEPVGVNQLARELKLVPSTCLHILRVLVDEGLVVFDPGSKRYAIDIGILPIARQAIQRNGFLKLVEQRITQLSEKFGVTAIATQISDPRHMVVVAISQAALPFRLQVDLGARFPALISASGRCLAAFNPIDRAEIESRFHRLKWDHPPDFETWLAEIDTTRQRGYGVDRGSYISGVTIIAVPLFDRSGQMTRSIVAIGITEKMESIGIPVVARDMIAMRNDLSTLLVNDHPSRSPAGRKTRASETLIWRLPR